MRKQTAHRWRLIITLLLGVSAAFGTFWLVQLLNQSAEEMQADKRLNEPDYIIENFSFVRMSKDGKPSYIVSGDKLTHRPIDDASDIDKPVLRNLGRERPAMHAQAERARVDEGNTRVALQGNVTVERPAAGNAQRMLLTTQALTIYPEEDRMESDRPVAMDLGNATASGNGMHANNATRQVHLNGRGSIVYPPPARK
ncbi:MAG: LPS export ABC transporter periplasmic protein LptC [Pseudomonadota bacterium]